MKPIYTIARDLPIHASFAQQRLWFLDRLLGASSLYNMPWVVQLNGKLDVPALQQSLNAIVARHEALRTAFIEQDGEPFQVINPLLPFACALLDLSAYSQEYRDSHIQGILDIEANTAFDLKQAPLIRGLLIKLTDQAYILSITMHHIISDGWSLTVFTRELESFYRVYSQGQPSSLPDLPIQYADYTVWQREWLQGEVLENQLGFWKTQLADLTTLELPTDKPRPKQPSYQGAHTTFHLSNTLIDALKSLGQQQNATLFMTLLAAFQLLLYRYSRQDDIVVGTATHGRNQEEVKDLIGFFINTIVLRSDLSGNPTFNELLTRVNKVCVDSYRTLDHQNMPFDKLVTELQSSRDMSRHPLFQVTLIMQPKASQEMQLPDITITKMTLPMMDTAKFDLGVSLEEDANGITGTIAYSTDLFTADTITRFAEHFETLLTAIVERPDTHIADLPLLTTAERQQILFDWNATAADYPQDSCIHELFEQQVAKTPQAVAVVFEGKQLTYAELNAQANQLAHHLRELGVKPDVIVAICLQRSFNMLVGLLAILKAGGAYVPLNPAYPVDMLTTILEDSAPIALLTHSKIGHLFANLTNTLPVIDLDMPSPPWASQPGSNLNRRDLGLTPTHLAYIIYTSGSMGKPKGVMIEHRGVCNMITDVKKRYALTANDRMLQFSPIAFDVSVQEIFITLSSGAGLVLRGDDWTLNSDNWLSSTHSFWALCEKNNVTVVKLPTTFWQQLIQEEQVTIPATIRLNIIGGEAVNSNVLASWFERTSYRPTLFNAYGPTETTVNSTIQETSATALSFQSIGRPIANTRIYILDDTQQPVPICVAGELYIGGVGVARGYLKRPDLTAAQFFPDPFSEAPNARMYKTGDLVRWLADGTIEYLGRNDFQVKVRGFRIELGHIEAKLLEHPMVREAAVLAHENNGVKRLVGYLAAKEDSVPSIAELRDFLKDRVPEFMIPYTFIFLDALPLTPNGKLNRKALPVPDSSLHLMDNDFVAPRNQIEQQLADILGRILQIDRVGIHDNFFELGGHSLLAVKFIVEVNKLFNIDLALGTFYQSPTVEELGNIIASGKQHPSWYSLMPIRTQGSRPPLFAVHTVILEDLARLLGNDQPLYFLRYGMAAVISDQSLQLPLLEELASHYIKEMQQAQPHGPYYLIGFSFGGMIAYEMACQLKASGYQVNLIGLLDTYLSNEKQLLPYHVIIQKFFKLKPNQLLELVKNKIDYLQHQDSEEAITDFNPHVYAIGPDLVCRNGYQPKMYNDRVTLFQASDRESMFFVNTPPEQGWKELLGDKLDIQQVTGAHHDMCLEPHVKILVEKITACMDKAMGDG